MHGSGQFRSAVRVGGGRGGGRRSGGRGAAAEAAVADDVTAARHHRRARVALTRRLDGAETSRYPPSPPL